MNDDTNWLRWSRITCPGCQRQWEHVDRSPMADDMRLYCDHCGNSVEVSWYDPRVMAIFDGSSQPDHKKFRAVEVQLRSCDCGGHFRHDSPRRCTECLAILVADELGVDLYPYSYEYEPVYRDPTPAEQTEFEAFEAAHIRTEDIWQRELR